MTLKLLLERSYSARELAARFKACGVLIPMGTIYPLLNSLRQRKLLIRGREESETGGSMLTFSISEKGRRHFQVMKRGWDRLVRMIAGL